MCKHQSQPAMTTILLIAVSLAALTATASAGTHATTATGRVFCRINGQSVPVKQAEVKVLDDDLIFDDLVAETETGLDGSFAVSGEARDIFVVPHIYVAVFYKYSDMLEIDGLFGITRFHRTSSMLIQQTTNFGDIYISDDHCRAYVHFYDAINDYKNRTGNTKLPYSTLHVCTHAIIHGGTPYALTDKALVPENYPLSLETAKHELAHTVRHSLDGNLAHLAYDALRFNYFRHHYCGLKTNEGFAFNEGWAEFWAGSCTAASYGTSPTDYTIEGNVANGLRQLKAAYGLSDFDMVDILDNSNSTIHSFTEYQTALIKGFIY